VRLWVRGVSREPGGSLRFRVVARELVPEVGSVRCEAAILVDPLHISFTLDILAQRNGFRLESYSYVKDGRAKWIRICEAEVWRIAASQELQRKTTTALRIFFCCNCAKVPVSKI